MSPSPSSAQAGDVPARVWSGTFLQVAGRVFGSACTLAILALLSRQISGEEFGRFTFYIGVFALLDALTDFGTGQLAVQRTAGDPWAVPGTLRVARRIRLTMAAVGALALAVGAFAFEEPGALWIALAGLYPLSHAFELSALVFRNEIRFLEPVLVRAGASALRLALVVALLFLDVQLAALYVFVSALGSGMANLLLHLVSRRHLPRPTIAVAEPRHFWRDVLPLGVSGLCQQAYFYVDNLFVRASCGEESLGHYNGGVRLLSFCIMAAQYASVAGMPWLVRRAEPGLAGAAPSAALVSSAAARLAQPMFAAASLAAGIATPLASALLVLLYGEPFAAAGRSFQWLLAAAAVIYAGAALLTAVVALGNTRAVLAITLSALAVNVAGNALLTPRYGIAGAGAATLVTEASVVLGSLLVLTRRGGRPLAERPLAWLAAPVAYAAGWWLTAQVLG